MKKKSIKRWLCLGTAALFAFCCINTGYSSAEELGYGSSNTSDQASIGSGSEGIESEKETSSRSSGTWEQSPDGRWRYRYSNGTYATNTWEFINGKWYHFDSNGWMQTGWLLDGGKWYFLKPSTGEMVTGFYTIQGKRYFFNPSGEMVTGWYQIQNKWYYFESTGEMATGWKEIDDKWYYFDSEGIMLTGWRKISNAVGEYWYYFKPSGVMATGWYNVNGYTYYSNSLGQYQETTRRAIIIGNPEDKTESDVDSWEQCFSHLSFRGDSISSDQIVADCHITRSQFQTYVQNIMSQARESDITYISLTCTNEQTDAIDIFSDGSLTGQTLRSMIDSYQGKVVILLNCNYAGSVINRSGLSDERVETMCLENEFVSAFTDDTRSGELINSKYLVLCSCSYDGGSYFNNNPGNYCYWYANKYWMLGGGWNSLTNTSTTMLADTNSDSIVSLSELYTYSHNGILNDPELNQAGVYQNVVVYPENSNFTIFARTNSN